MTWLKWIVVGLVLLGLLYGACEAIFLHSGNIFFASAATMIACGMALVAAVVIVWALAAITKRSAPGAERDRH